MALLHTERDSAYRNAEAGPSGCIPGDGFSYRGKHIRHRLAQNDYVVGDEFAGYTLPIAKAFVDKLIADEAVKAADDNIADYVPLLDYVLVDVEAEVETKSAGGIIIPDQSAKAVTEGRVVAAGPGNHSNGVWIENRVRVGQWVRFGNWAAGPERRIKVAGRILLLMREEDCLMMRPSRFYAMPGTEHR